MPASAERPAALVDTSVAVALSVGAHPQHQSVRQALADEVLGLSGHAAFESFSVLTRLPPPLRRAPAVVSEILSRNFPASRFLSAPGADALVQEAPQLGIAGGAIYDALVAACAREHGLALVTRDRRALDTYRALEIELRVLA